MNQLPPPKGIGLRGLNMNEEYIVYDPTGDECYITDTKPS